MVHSRGVRMTDYAELAVTTNFSFLRGASHPAELVAQAKLLGLSAIGVADRNTLAGVVRAHTAAKEAGLKLLVGARLVLEDRLEIICYPEDRPAYGRLSRLLSVGKIRAEKGECHIRLEDIEAHGEGQVFIFMPPERIDRYFQEALQRFADLFPGQVYLGAVYDFLGRARELIAALADLGARANAPLVALGDALYHVPDRRPLQDAVTCIREHCRIDEAGFRLHQNAEKHLKLPEEMARLFRGFEPAIKRTMEISRRCTFSLDELSYAYPDEPVPPDKTPEQHLADLAWAGADWRYPEGVPDHVEAALKKELNLISELKVAQYFLTVNDIVAWARNEEILCQGRGSAANSAICYCLGITSVDPATSNLLFERFLSKERKEPPDIDVDFEHERREEVMQYVFERYGRKRAALTATVISYRPRSAIREVCKALGLTEDISAALAGTVWGSWGSDIPNDQIRGAGLDPANPMIRRAMLLTRQLIGFPRHLSQHVGGFVLTQDELVETVPIGNAAMEDRTFIEWDKDDIAALNIMKVDVLALGMLTCIRKAFELLEDHKGIRHNLASLPEGDTATYDMLCRGESLGVFQVESRAQMNMLPRLKPRCLYDLVIEVAIVRPGPIQGDMVHPYLRRRKKIEPVTYPSPAPEHGPSDELEKILERTLGVPLFQEQAMQIAMDAAEFTADEANGLRRAMATFRKLGTIKDYEDLMVSRMIKRGYEPGFAQRCFDQVKGFGDYGFPESHAASFALLVYVSSWLKCHHPDVFCTALLNSQPMGFYAPAQIVRDARDNGVEVRPVDVNYSDWDNLIEPSLIASGLASQAHETGSRLSDSTSKAQAQLARTRSEEQQASKPKKCAVRLGFRQINGMSEDEAEAIMGARRAGYKTPEELRRRAGVSRRTMEVLASADAFGSMDLSRREALWAVRGEAAGATLPLFAAADAAEQGDDTVITLPEMPRSEHVVQDYQMTRLSLRDHPMHFLRDQYAKRRILRTDVAVARPNGHRVNTAGVVLVRQRPGSASGVCFITIEDEGGIANIVVWPRVFDRFRSIIMGSRILLVKGRVQRADNVTHIVADQLIDRTNDFMQLSEDFQRDPLKEALAPTDHVLCGAPERRGPGRRHPRNVDIMPRSRDFH
ncbi:MAG: error-prone DNA polymerase [Pseudomonadota bacterium]